MTVTVAGRTLVDAHAHFYATFPLDECFRAAATNFRQAMRDASRQSGRPQGGATAMDVPDRAVSDVGCLIVHELDDARPALAWLRDATEVLLPDWRIEWVESQASAILRAQRTDWPIIAVVSGQQLVSSEGIEVLAFGVADGHTLFRHSRRARLDELLFAIRTAGGVATVPWGFGKWWLRRGGVVRRLLDHDNQATMAGMFWGDNGGRPGRDALRLARGDEAARGRSILAGSDPLPLGGEHERWASYGSVLPSVVDLARPSEWLRDQLLALKSQPDYFGQRVSWWQCLRQQVRLRIHGRGCSSVTS